MSGMFSTLYHLHDDPKDVPDLNNKLWVYDKNLQLMLGINEGQTRTLEVIAENTGGIDLLDFAIGASVGGLAGVGAAASFAVASEGTHRLATHIKDTHLLPEKEHIAALCYNTVLNKVSSLSYQYTNQNQVINIQNRINGLEKLRTDIQQLIPQYKHNPVIQMGLASGINNINFYLNKYHQQNTTPSLSLPNTHDVEHPSAQLVKFRSRNTEPMLNNHQKNQVDKFVKNYGINPEHLNQQTKSMIFNLGRRYENARMQQQLNVQQSFQFLGDTFNCISMIGSMTGNNKLAQIAGIGGNVIGLMQKLSALPGAIMQAPTALAALSPVMGIATALFSIVGLFRRKKSGNPFAPIMKQLQAISEQIAAIHRDMIQGFNMLAQGQQKIYTTMLQRFQRLEILIQEENFNLGQTLSQGFSRLDNFLSLVHSDLSSQINYLYLQKFNELCGLIENAISPDKSIESRKALLTMIQDKEVVLFENWILEESTSGMLNGERFVNFLREKRIENPEILINNKLISETGIHLEYFIGYLGCIVAHLLKDPVTVESVNNADNQKIPGLIFQEIKGDGHCLYNAVALYLGKDQQTLRNEVANYLETHLNELREFITLPTGSTIEQYIQSIRAGREWAAHVEIQILMRVLNRPIVVVGSDNKIRNRDDIAQYASEPIFVWYNGSTHYNALLKAQDCSLNDVMQFLTEDHNHSNEQQSLSISELNQNLINPLFWLEGIKLYVELRRNLSELTIEHDKDNKRLNQMRQLAIKYVKFIEALQKNSKQLFEKLLSFHHNCLALIHDKANKLFLDNLLKRNSLQERDHFKSLLHFNYEEKFIKESINAELHGQVLQQFKSYGEYLKQEIQKVEQSYVGRIQLLLKHIIENKSFDQMVDLFQGPLCPFARHKAGTGRGQSYLEVYHHPEHFSHFEDYGFKIPVCLASLFEKDAALKAAIPKICFMAETLGLGHFEISFIAHYKNNGKYLDEEHKILNESEAFYNYHYKFELNFVHYGQTTHKICEFDCNAEQIPVTEPIMMSARIAKILRKHARAVHIGIPGHTIPQRFEYWALANINTKLSVFNQMRYLCKVDNVNKSITDQQQKILINDITVQLNKKLDELKLSYYQFLRHPLQLTQLTDEFDQLNSNRNLILAFMYLSGFSQQSIAKAKELWRSTTYIQHLAINQQLTLEPLQNILIENSSPPENNTLLNIINDSNNQAEHELMKIITNNNPKVVSKGFKVAEIEMMLHLLDSAEFLQAAHLDIASDEQLENRGHRENVTKRTHQEEQSSTSKRTRPSDSPIESETTKLIKRISSTALYFLLQRSTLTFSDEEKNAIKNKLMHELAKNLYQSVIANISNERQITDLSQHIVYCAVSGVLKMTEQDKKLHSRTIRLGIEEYLNSLRQAPASQEHRETMNL